jgi:NADH-quinone oxidoreductase subunit E
VTRMAGTVLPPRARGDRSLGREVPGGPAALGRARRALRAAQHENDGYLTVALMDAVAAYLGLPAVQVYEVATFYSMFETEPCGRHHVSVCTNISCMLRGGEDLLRMLEQKLGIRVGESTPDGRIFLKREEECLAACCGAPMMMVDHVYHENLTPGALDEILEGLE